MRDTRSHEHRAAGACALQQRIHAADELPIGGDVDRKHVVPVLRLEVVERRRHAENAGIADQHVEAPVAFVERQREPRDAVGIFHVERHQRGRAAGRLDLVVEFFQPADRARHRHHMGAGLRQLQRDRRANAARGAGDQRDFVGEGFVAVYGLVMPGFMPRIHVFRSSQPFRRGGWHAQVALASYAK